MSTWGTPAAIMAFITAVLVAWQNRRLAKHVEVVHILVNSQLKTVLDRVDQLTQTLHDADVEVPDAKDRDGTG